MRRAPPRPGACAPPARATAICRCAGGPSAGDDALARLLRCASSCSFSASELGERRIRIGLLVAAVPALAAPLDVFRAQIRIALRTIAARPTRSDGRRVAAGSPALLRTVAAIAALGAPRMLRPIRALPALGLVAALADRGARGDGGRRSPPSGARSDTRRRVGDGRRGRARASAPTATAASAAAATGGACVCRGGRRWRRRAFVARLARMLVATAGPPDFDQFLGRGLGLRCDVRRWASGDGSGDACVGALPRPARPARLARRRRAPAPRCPPRRPAPQASARARDRLVSGHCRRVDHRLDGASRSSSIAASARSLGFNRKRRHGGVIARRSFRRSFRQASRVRRKASGDVGFRRQASEGDASGAATSAGTPPAQLARPRRRLGRLRPLLHAIAERAQDRGEVLARRAGQRGHRDR